MRRLRTAGWSPRSAWALSALLLSVLWTVGLPAPAQGALATSYKVLHSFSLPASGLPVAPSGLLQTGPDAFAGTTYYGGAANLGSVFQVTPTGTLSPLYSFTGQTDGVYPSAAAGLLQDSAGTLYGTTRQGGDADLGTLFTLTSTGTFTTVHSFSGSDGQYPQASLLRDADGTLYGTTTEGGGPGYGTVFKLDSTNNFTTLYLFSGGTDGANPQADLVRAPDGTLYGTTYAGGSANLGTVFKLTPTGGAFTLTTLHTFTGSAGEGAHPQGPLLLDAGGNTLYGTTYAGGTFNLGTVFRLSLTGTPTLTTLHAFSGPEGAYPSAGLLQGADGDLYGTTFGTCPYGDPACTGTYGTVYTLAPDGTGFTVLHTFAGAEGANPQTGLLQGSDGYFYGSTLHGGAANGGVVFVLRRGNPLTVIPAGTGTGTVTSAPAGISCPGTCTEVFPATTPVTLTATPATGSDFTGWSGTGITCPGTGPCTVDMTQGQTVTATFTLQNFTLSVNKAGTGAGTVTSSPAGIACGATCSAEFAYGTPVTLTATPAAGCTLTWGGACTGTGSTAPCTLTLDRARSVTATFDDTTAPTITHTPVQSWKENTALPITATITDNLGVQGATLFYRTTGVGAFSSLPMTPGTTYSRSIPVGVVVRPAGVEYYLEARDAAGNVRRLPSGTGTYPVVVGTSSFTDDPLVPGSTPIKLAHFTDLLTAINAVRTKAPYNLPAFTWSTPAPAAGGTVRAIHLTELRTALTAPALNAAYKAKYGKDITFGEAITAGVVIKASHLSELRMHVRALE